MSDNTLTARRPKYYDPEQVAHLEKELFEIDGKFDVEHIKPGAVVRAVWLMPRHIAECQCLHILMTAATASVVTAAVFAAESCLRSTASLMSSI